MSCRLCIAAAALLLAFSQQGAVQAVSVPVPANAVVQAPDWQLGSEWYYSDGYALKVTSVTPQATVFDRIDAPGQWFSRHGFIRKDSASPTATRNAIYRTIADDAGLSLSARTPLTFQREYLSNGKLVVHASSWTVEGRETITVPAGTFDCWVIVWRTRSLRSDWTGFERWWYSPQAQQYVRLEYKYGPDTEGSRVLMRYRIGPALAAETPAVAPAALEKRTELPPQNPPVKAEASVPAPSVAVLEKRELPPPEKPQPAPLKTAEAAPVPPTPTPMSLQPDVLPQQVAREEQVAVPKQPAGPPPKSDGGDWHAQVGSSKDAAAMQVGLHKFLARHPRLAAVPNGISPHVVGDRGTFYRAWLGAFVRQADALTLCRGMQSTGCAIFKAPVVEARNVQPASKAAR